MKKLVVIGPKGGSGKTTMARNLAVAAVLSGYRVGILDTDPQGTLSTWHGFRPENFPAIELFAKPFREITGDIDPVEGLDLLITDTPPSVEENMKGFRALVDGADFVLLPTGTSGEDIDSLGKTIKALRLTSASFGVVLNRIKPKLVETATAKRTLAAAVSVAPKVLPDLTEIFRTFDAGVGVLELRGAKSTEAMWALWHYVSKNMGLER
jgi:chromosome partitioning protein